MRGSLPPRGKHAAGPVRAWSLLGGFSFVVAAISWLILNEQRRRARVALVRAFTQSSPQTRARARDLWRWWRDAWGDPWAIYRERVAGEATGQVLEIGVGSWRNLRRYHRATTVIGTAPHRRQVFAALRRARRVRPGTAVVRAAAEQLPFPDASFDTIVTNLALCSVRDQGAALREIARVLRPGGSLRFLEHVRSDHPMMAAFQDLMTPIWRLTVDGCHPNRTTLAALSAAGFAITVREEGVGAWGPARPTVWGVAMRAPSNAEPGAALNQLPDSIAEITTNQTAGGTL